MISYELAKQLKDVGFTQNENGYKLFREEGWRWDEPHYFNGNDRTMEEKYFSPEYVKKHLDWLVVCPTLSELIEACGDNLQALARKSQTDSIEPLWIATSKTAWIQTTGSTPEEAVANLWLELNK